MKPGDMVLVNAHSRHGRISVWSDLTDAACEVALFDNGSLLLVVATEDMTREDRHDAYMSYAYCVCSQGVGWVRQAFVKKVEVT